MKFRNRVLAGFFGTACVVGLVLIPSSGLEPGHEKFDAKVTYGAQTDNTKRVTVLTMGDLEAVQDAAKYAQWCGGVLEVWSDGDLVVSGCDE